MATAGREYSLDHHLMERMKFSGIDRDNLADLVSIVVSLKNKYGIVPLAAAAQGYPLPNALTVSYVIESITLNKIFNILLDISTSQRDHHFAARLSQIGPVRRRHHPRRIVLAAIMSTIFSAPIYLDITSNSWYNPSCCLKSNPIFRVGPPIPYLFHLRYIMFRIHHSSHKPCVFMRLVHDIHHTRGVGSMPATQSESAPAAAWESLLFS